MQPNSETNGRSADIRSRARRAAVRTALATGVGVIGIANADHIPVLSQVKPAIVEAIGTFNDNAPDHLNNEPTMDQLLIREAMRVVDSSKD